MNNEKEISKLFAAGFVILKASNTTNAPIGWKGKDRRWGYVKQMADESLAIYKSTFSATILSRSHCGFYLGHNNLCCIDLDTKKTTEDVTTSLMQKIKKVLGKIVAIETTKSHGYHIYFRYKAEDNLPNFTGLGNDNWIELYHSKRFIACYLSNSNRYKLIHGSISELPILSKAEYSKLMVTLAPFKGKDTPKVNKKGKAAVIDMTTWEQAEAYTKQIEQKGLDITGDNPVWFKIGKALASSFGEKGFDLFDRVSQFSPKYNADTIREDYQKYVDYDYSRRGEKITIATFFKMCADAGLADIATQNTLKLYPKVSHTEFELPISKKEPMAEKVHTLIKVFCDNVHICCIDKVNYYVYETTHWIKRNPKQVVDLLKDFINRSEVDDVVKKSLYTLPYLEMALREIALITMVDAIEPNTGNLRDGIFINMENGVLHVDIKTGKRKLLDHEAKYNFTSVLPFCYDPTKNCPSFDKWMSTQIPNKDAHVAYYSFVASCLTKHKADIIMLLAGDTSTGKSSLIEITRRLIGLENAAAISASTLFSGTPEAQTQAMQMENKLLAYDFDAQPFKHLEMLLKVAAQEPIPGWQMHVARRPVSNYGRLLIAMNPHNYSVFTPAVARRFVTINMDIKVVKDNNVIPNIYENELAGIFNNVLNVGVKHLIENGGQIITTESIRKATVDFHMNSRDSIRWFQSRFIQLKPSSDKSNRVSALEKLRKCNPGIEIQFTTISQMYSMFRVWMEDHEGYPVSKLPIRKHFAADLKLIGVEDYVTKSEGLGLYIGIK